MLHLGASCKAVGATFLGSEALRRRPSPRLEPRLRACEESHLGLPGSSPDDAALRASLAKRMSSRDKPSSQGLPAGKSTQGHHSPSCLDTSVMPRCSLLRSDRNYLAVCKFHFFFFQYFSCSLKGRGVTNFWTVKQEGCQVGHSKAGLLKTSSTDYLLSFHQLEFQRDG